MKIKLLKNNKYLQQEFSQKVLVCQTTTVTNSTLGVSKSYTPCTCICKFPMDMNLCWFFRSAVSLELNILFLVTTTLV